MIGERLPMKEIRDFAWPALIWALLAVHPAAGQAPPKQTDAKAIAALIEQLGSAGYQRREGATRALEKIGRPALAALREAAEKHGDAEVRRRAKGLVEKIENSLEQLLEDYRAYGLPLPPKDAPLINFELVESKIGFLLGPATA